MVREPTANEHLLRQLRESALWRFKDWPCGDVPHVASGVYTIWNQAGDYIYVGMAGRSLTAKGIMERGRVPPLARDYGITQLPCIRQA
jgi:hypothetical protein